LFGGAHQGRSRVQGVLRADERRYFSDFSLQFFLDLLLIRQRFVRNPSAKT
jgi:hypothetical protein